ncbi:uncharacterized protein L969DRAFT_49607 [Mixia osmundae IAM 14324]|uniref:DNA polymerase delta subunit 4 n=1 Tax=Mixia osmundae (strain CBS 9802 / IAM 14324 / JCM 22182 / KY 12970) TaxID=764103 RepID=G7E0S8_MIXOS|nr:uncharacterized protein L969DRAFT_49607 [Mixia osmundae IAM 14324]KEI39469.1 hypothetical protein L969DRAFT_49607 [Mixia osmundae IAM 14324]GAA96438.1 hypothetical protein E5Q_03105 [Mixia osmundae IAM 14324]
MVGKAKLRRTPSAENGQTTLKSAFKSSKATSKAPGKKVISSQTKQASTIKKAPLTPSRRTQDIEEARESVGVSPKKRSQLLSQSGRESASSVSKNSTITSVSGPVPVGPELNVNDSKYDAHFRVVKDEFLGGKKPIHGADQSKVEQILRCFDMTFDYGPSIGMTRLERWDRAEALGLQPPEEVKDILLTKQGIEKASLREVVFADILA